MTEAVTTAQTHASRPAGRKPRVGILGAGFIADFHIRPLKMLPVELAAVFDPKPERATSLQKKWGIPAVYSDLGRMLGEARLDVVHILAPPPYHKDTAVTCLRAGVDVFLEKPVAVNVAECEELQAVAAQYGRRVGVNHNALFHPAFRRVVREIQSRRIGGVQHVTACVNVPLRQLQAGQHGHWMFQKPGNIVLEQAPHPFSQIFMLAGSMLKSSVLVSGRTELNTGVPFYDTWQISMLCQRATAQCVLSFGKDYLDSWVHVIGQDGTLTADLRRNVVRFAGKTRFMEPVDNFLVSREASRAWGRQGFVNFRDYALGFLGMAPPADPFVVGMQDSIHAFYRARQRGNGPPVTLASATDVIRACEWIPRQAGVAAEYEVSQYA